MRFFLIDRITRWEVGFLAEGGKVKAAANRGDTLVTSTEMVFAFKQIDDPLLDEKRQRLMDLWRQ